MKKPMRKVKKFDTGGLSKAQEEWLGGADRTDPIIMARMRKAVPDEAKTETAPAKVEPAKVEPAKVEVKTETKTTSEDIVDETGTKSKFKRNLETGDLYTPIENMEKSVAKTTKPAASSSSTSNAKPAEKPAEKPAAKAETKPAKTVYIPNKDASADNRDIGEKKPAPPKPDPSPGRLGFRGDFFSGRPYGSEKFEKEQRSKKSMAAEGNYKKGGAVKSASARADGCAIRGKTRA
jgi:hypothetical protein